MSNLIKSNHVVSLDDLKRLELKMRFQPPPRPRPDEAEGDPQERIDAETRDLQERIIRDAESAAEQLLQQARQSAEEMRARAGEEIEAWWQERRQQDSEAVEAGRQAGFEEGYRSGAEQGEREMKAQWESRLAEARDIVTQAYAARERIIAEAEQFLVQLSCSIAEKIIQTRLAETPAVALDMIASALARRKEQGVITLCVSPAQFAFVNAAKDELLPAVDPQASLQIVPDPAVKDGGCIIRSAFGSIDARVDTQLAAIREELVRAAAQAGEERGPDVADA